MFWRSKTFFDSAELQWKYICGVDIDGTLVTVESRSGFQKKFTNLLLKQKALTVSYTDVRLLEELYLLL